MQKTYYSRSQTAKRLMSEFESLSGKSVKYPKSNADLERLKNEVDQFRHEKEKERQKLLLSLVHEEIKSHKGLGRPNKKTRNIDARQLMDEYKLLTGKSAKYPKSNADLEQLQDSIKKIYENRSKLTVEVTQTSLNECNKTYKIRINDHSRPLREILNDVVKFIQHNDGTVKILVRVHAVLKRPVNEEKTEHYFESSIIKIFKNADAEDISTGIMQNLKQHEQDRHYLLRVDEPDYDIDDLINKIIQNYDRQIDEFTEKGSGWTFDGIIDLLIDVHKFNPLRDGKFVELPDKIKKTHCCINVVSDDNKCVMWSILAALFPVAHHANRVCNYQQYVDRLDLRGIDFPTPINQIGKIENQNRELIPEGINVYGLDENKKIFPLRISPLAGPRTINLLRYNKHMSWIKNFSGLVKSQYNNHQHKLYFCYKCLHGFSGQELINNHVKYCVYDQKTTLPKECDKYLSFTNYKKKFTIPFSIAYDFESILQSIDDVSTAGSRLTKHVNVHVPVAVAYKVTCIIDPTLSQPVRLYRRRSISEEDPAVWLLKNLFMEATKINNRLSKVTPMFPLTPEQQNNHNTASICHICEKEFDADSKVLTDLGIGSWNKVYDHCHLTGQYRGAAHNYCNLKFHALRFIPCIAHNFRGYDGHFIIRALGHPDIVRLCNNQKIDCIPNNAEKIMSLTVGSLRFIDSMQFMPTSLELLARNCGEFPSLTEYFGDTVMLMKEKGIFPYEYINNFDRLNETLLPNKDQFYSTLSKEHISDRDYIHANNVWNRFNCQNIGDYLDIYLIQDVLLLDDIFRSFRLTSINKYGLDPGWYFSSPGLSWDAAFKLTKAKIELITDGNIDHYNFISKSIRGGISVISKKHALANNKYLSDYDPEKPSCYMLYEDKNALYSWGMCQAMPVRCVGWVSAERFIEYTNNLTVDLTNSKFSFYVEVDVDYPEELHDLHNDYPFLPEKMIISDSLLSSTQLHNRVGKPCIVEKLVPNLLNKRNYVCHYRNLKQAVDAGLKIIKIHRVLMIEQSFWMAKYIIFNNDMRTKATTDFEKDFFKLMNNSVFGKTMENIFNRVDIEIVNSHKRCSKLIASERFAGIIPICKDVVMVKKHKTNLILNKPIFVGATVLETSKWLMYEFHYNFVKKIWPNSNLLFTDTDSLVYEIFAKDVYQDIFDHKDEFDLSDVPKENKFHDPTNKKVMGKMKDEFCFKPVAEFIGLRSKMYAVRVDDGKESKKAKGVKKCVVKSNITFNDYKNVLFNGLKHSAEMVSFRSYKHQVNTDLVIKQGLTNFDDKRWCEDGINTLALGHYKTK